MTTNYASSIDMAYAEQECRSELSSMMAEFRAQDAALRAITDLELCRRIVGIWYFGWCRNRDEFHRRGLGSIQRTKRGIGKEMTVIISKNQKQLLSDCSCLLAEWESANNEDDYFQSFPVPEIKFELED